LSSSPAGCTCLARRFRNIVDGDALAELREYFEDFWEDALAAFQEAAEKGESGESADE
jgi:hypothetical protein